MFQMKHICAALAALLVAAAPGCADAPESFYGYDLTDHRLSIHALGFAGLLLGRDDAECERIRAAGALQVLAAVGCD